MNTGTDGLQAGKLLTCQHLDTSHLEQDQLFRSAVHSSSCARAVGWVAVEKGKRKGRAPFIVRMLSKCSDMDHSFTCKLYYACLSFVSIHQMAPPLTKVADIQLQLTNHFSTSKGVALVGGPIAGGLPI